MNDREVVESRNNVERIGDYLHNRVVFCLFVMVVFINRENEKFPTY